MLEIQKNKFEIKYTDINIRQRMYHDDSYITLMINTEFYPSLVDENIISGSIDIKLDLKNIKSIDDLSNTNYSGAIGNVTISVNNDGIWEHKSYDKFKIKIDKRNGKQIDFELDAKDCKLKTTGRIISLYTTSSSQDDLAQNFDLKDFHVIPTVKEIGNSKISRYYIK